MAVHSSPPFNAPAARRLRAALGMAPGHVAYGLRAQYGLIVAPETVMAWERGEISPTSAELTALAGVLWCSPGELLAEPVTLREHRIARGMSGEELSRRIGLDENSYQKMEDTGRWKGNERQSAALATTLGLTLAQFVTATGKHEELAGLLRGAVTTRWQAYAKPLSKLLPVPREHLERVLEQLYGEYQSRMVATLSWGTGGGAAGTGDAGREYLAEIVDRFWAVAGGST
ncbi:MULTISPECIES: helix-turn-helix domain-containing protein [unclassified Streptomyces]|uniref:helix-turn-helix domain-containing protein n=1 Tax=unclassified Streptomyces TaxID=2593676 RepID=UPI001BEAD09B|nr:MULTISPECIES: helix-turn-helix domain-containing protein [unclassified Streptomyces]MBT2403933.1 helix-turn-helix domain-containing protein [Streptomyces sp. ISL-21]MBT2459282.1 helix-turn-helix domain-containing protein [Streptomyces sp. ISL-86]MBT2608412.1 helix-turn-helix domain-containing protein [Streptomyces sp. ISL-87]